MQELVAWAGRLCEQQLKVPQGRTSWTGERVPRDGQLARSWRSSPWFQQLPGSLLHGPAASVCSAERRRPSAAHRSRTVDIVDIFLHRIDGNRSGMQEASCSAQAPSGCNRRSHGTSGGPGGPRGATSVVRGTMCVRVPCVLFSLYRRVHYSRQNFEVGFQVPGSGLAVRPGPRFRGSEVPGSTLGRRFQVPGKRGWGDAEHGACHALRRARTRTTTLAHFCFEKTFLCDNLWGCELESGLSVRVGARRDSGRPNREVRT